MGFFEKEHGTQTLERPKSDRDRTEPQRSESTTSAGASLVAHATPRSDTGRSIRSGTSFRVRWTNQDGDVLSEYMQTISHTGKPMGMLNVCRPDGWPAGNYKLEVLLNDTPAATMDLEVK